jgi:hypothetical protein
MKVIVVSPVGRKSTLTILKKYIDKLKERGIIDEWHLWFNVKHDEDRDYVLSLENEYTKIIRLFDKEHPGFGTPSTIGYFFTSCCDPDSIYIRLDDDIVYVDIEGFKNLVEFRKADRTHFLVYPIIINNIFSSAFLQKYNAITYPKSSNLIERWAARESSIRTTEIAGRDVTTLRLHDYYKGSTFLDSLYWADSQFCEFIHRKLLENITTPNKLYIQNIELSNHECMSIQAISWRGEDMKGVPTEEEESWLAYFNPKLTGKKNILFGTCVVGHYSHYNQLAALNRTDILDQYRKGADSL